MAAVVSLWPDRLFRSRNQSEPAVVLGKKIFLRPVFVPSGRMSCATCHSPAHAYGPPNGLAVQLGGPELNRQGARAVPSLRYVLNRTPLWNKKYIENPAERLLEGDEPPVGGFGWDGRFRHSARARRLSAFGAE